MPEAVQRCARAILAPAWLLAQLGCSGSPPDAHNVLLISVDTLRADHLGIYGYERDTSPNLDRFFSEGSVFERGSSTAPCTIPSIRQYLHGSFQAPGRGEPLAEVLRGHGYATAAVVSQHQLHKDGVDAYARGFSHFDLQAPDEVDHHDMTARTADQVSDRALAWLDDNAEGSRFFLWLHYFDPHDPYAPPEGFRDFDAGNRSTRSGDVRALRALARTLKEPGRSHKHPFAPEDAAHFRNLYDGEILFVDAQIARVLTALEQRGLAARTLFFLVADHGELLGETGRFGHCRTLMEEVIRVPFLVRVGEGRLGEVERSDLPVSTLDVLPTTLGLLGIAYDPSAYDGLDLRKAPPDRTVLAFWRKGSVIRRGPWKQVFQGGRVQALYDLARDPAEGTNLRATRTAVRDELSAEMAALSELAGSAEEESQRAVELLEQIGYLQ